MARKPEKLRLTTPRPKEAPVQRAILTALKLHPRVGVWRQNTGAHSFESKGKRRFVQYGTRGAADITGMIKPWGVRLEVEVKRPEYASTGEERLSKHQKEFRRWVTEHGAVYIVATSVEEALGRLNEAIRGLDERFSETAALV